MDGFSVFKDFFVLTEGDARMGPIHLWLYMALLHQWAAYGFEVPHTIKQKELLQAARISRRTYHKSMRELQAYGYIRYLPSFDPFVPSKVYLIIIDKKQGLKK